LFTVYISVETEWREALGPTASWRERATRLGVGEPTRATARKTLRLGPPRVHSRRSHALDSCSPTSTKPVKPVKPQTARWPLRTRPGGPKSSPAAPAPRSRRRPLDADGPARRVGASAIPSCWETTRQRPRETASATGVMCPECNPPLCSAQDARLRTQRRSRVDPPTHVPSLAAGAPQASGADGLETSKPAAWIPPKPPSDPLPAAAVLPARTACGLHVSGIMWSSASVGGRPRSSVIRTEKIPVGVGLGRSHQGHLSTLTGRVRPPGPPAKITTVTSRLRRVLEACRTPKVTAGGAAAAARCIPLAGLPRHR